VSHIDAKRPGYLDEAIRTIPKLPVTEVISDPKTGRVLGKVLFDGKNRAVVSHDLRGHETPAWLLTSYERTAPATSGSVGWAPLGSGPTPPETARPSVPLPTGRTLDVPGSTLTRGGETTPSPNSGAPSSSITKPTAESAIAAPAAEPPRATRAAPVSAKERRKPEFVRRREIYIPGNVVRNYSGALDKVLDYNEKPDGSFQVKVQSVLPDGSIDPDYPRPRTHSTPPEKGDRIVSKAPVPETPATGPTAAPAIAEPPAGEPSAGAKTTAGSPGRLVSNLDDGAQAALDRIHARGTFSGRRAPANIPVDDLGDMAIYGAAKIAKGTVKFAAWSREMVAEIGARVEPLLHKLYADSRKIYERHISGIEGAIPTTKKLLTMYRAGKEGENWYRDTKAELRKHFGPDADMFIDFLAATSPNTTVASNLSLALKAYKQWKTGQPFSGYLPATIGSLNKAVAGEDFGELKVSSFRQNLHGDPIPVTVDRWIARAYGFTKDQGKINEGQYRFIDHAFSQIARERGIEPRQLPAAVWRTIKEAEQTNEGNTSEAFEGLVKSKISQDPELARLLNEAKTPSANALESAAKKPSALESSTEKRVRPKTPSARAEGVPAIRTTPSSSDRDWLGQVEAHIDTDANGEEHLYVNDPAARIIYAGLKAHDPLNAQWFDGVSGLR
jgi:hypothetical protein